MGEPKILTSRIKEDKKVVINLANGGGAGSGIVFIGGALATAALISVLTVGKKLLKSSKNRNHCPSTGSTSETPEVENIISTNTNKDESKGLYQSLSNGAAKRGVTETDVGRISSKSFYLEEKQNLEPHSGKGDPIYDDEEILLSKTEEFSFIVIKDQMLFQNENMKEAEETVSFLPLQSNEQQHSPSNSIDCDEDSNSTGCFSSKSSISIDQDLLVPLLQDEKLRSDSEEGSQAFETAEALEGAEAIKAVLAEKKCDEHQICLITETAEQLKRDDETLEAVHHDHSLIIQTVELLKKDEKLDADQEVEGKSGFLIGQNAEVIKSDNELDKEQADGGYSSTMKISGKEEKFDNNDSSLSVEDARGLELEEDKKYLEPPQDKDDTGILMPKKETSAPHDNENDAAKLLDVAAPVSSSDLQKQPTEEQESPPIDDVQEGDCVTDMITSDEVASESCGAQEPNILLEAQGVPSLLKSGIRSDSSFELLSEASEIREERVSSEPASEESEEGVIIESDIHPLKQSVGKSLEKIEETPATTEEDNLSVIGEMEMSEEDSINYDTDEANITDKVEENSEGTGDSSAEYNTEPIWPAESLKELSKDLAELKFKDQKENETLQTMEKMYLDKVDDHSVSFKTSMRAQTTQKWHSLASTCWSLRSRMFSK